MATFGEAPTEILLQVFSHLQQGDLVRCTRINRHWFNCASDHTLWRSVDLVHATRMPPTSLPVSDTLARRVLEATTLSLAPTYSADQYSIRIGDLGITKTNLLNFLRICHLIEEKPHLPPIDCLKTLKARFHQSAPSSLDTRFMSRLGIKLDHTPSTTFDHSSLGCTSDVNVAFARLQTLDLSYSTFDPPIALDKLLIYFVPGVQHLILDHTEGLRDIEPRYQAHQHSLNRLHTHDGNCCHFRLKTLSLRAAVLHETSLRQFFEARGPRIPRLKGLEMIDVSDPAVSAKEDSGESWGSAIDWPSLFRERLGRVPSLEQPFTVRMLGHLNPWVAAEKAECEALDAMERRFPGLRFVYRDVEPAKEAGLVVRTRDVGMIDV